MKYRGVVSRCVAGCVLCLVLVGAAGACKKKPGGEQSPVAEQVPPPPAVVEADAAPSGTEQGEFPAAADVAEAPADAGPTPPTGTEAEVPPASPDAGTPPPPAVEAAALTVEEAQKVAGVVNAFAGGIFPLLSKDKTNAAFSPTSLVVALGMTSSGARGETATQMDAVLHLGDDPDGVRDLLGRVLRLLPRGGDDAPVELAVANRLFGEQSYGFQQSFLDWTASQYAAPLEKVDFRGAYEAARGRINAWVAEQTHDRIPLILPDRSLNDLTRLVLVNAIYFKGKWALEFPRDATRPREFTLADGTKVDVPTMAVKGEFGFAVRNGVPMVELPYKGDELSMIVVLPPEGTEPDAWLTGANLDGIGTLPRRPVEVRLPSFKIDPAAPREMKDDLVALGMPLAFDKNQAEFDGIASPPDPTERLYIFAVYHKAFVLVDEEGTEAAASTAVVMAVRGGRPAPPPQFVADRPFLFFLRENRTGLILFAGRVGDPRASE